MAKLTFVLEDGQEVVVPLKEHTTIGRDEDNDIVVDDERLSSHHAEIVQNADGSLQVFDLKSTAGTFVNGEGQLSCTLLHGDTIAFGPLVGILDLEDAASAPDAETPPPPAAEPVPKAPAAPPPPGKAHLEAEKEAVAKLRSEKSQLKAEIAAAENDLRDWQQRAEKERALHLARLESEAPVSPAPPDNAYLEAEAQAVAKLEAEKSRLKAEIATAENDLRDWQQRAEKERAVHLARLESEAAVLPASPPPPDTAHLEAIARQEEALSKLEAEKARLKIEVAAAEKELLDWEQRAEKERAMHNARVETLRAEEEKLAPAKAAVTQAETAHHEWMEAISALSSQHENKTAALERLNSQHYEKSTEVQRLTAAAAEARQEIENLTTQKEEAAARLKQVRDECEQDEALLNALRQQIIEHEQRIVEEEAKHLALNTSSSALSAKQQRDEASVKDLESLLMTLEQSAAVAEGSLQRVQGNLAANERNLAARSGELTAIESSLATCRAELGTRSAELAAESRRLAEAQAQRAALEHRSQELAGAEQQLAEAAQRLAEAKAQRAELEQQNQELAGTKQQLADARQRLVAVEQRYRDAQAGGNQMAAPKRPAAQDDAAKASPPPEPAQLAEVNAQLEAARRELAELETKISSLRHSSSVPDGDIAQDGIAFPPPLIIQVETIKLPPIKIKSERTRGPAAKKAAGKS